MFDFQQLRILKKTTTFKFHRHVATEPAVSFSLLIYRALEVEFIIGRKKPIVTTNKRESVGIIRIVLVLIRIVLNLKTLVRVKELDSIAQLIKRVNPFAHICSTEFLNVITSVPVLLRVGSRKALMLGCFFFLMRLVRVKLDALDLRVIHVSF